MNAKNAKMNALKFAVLAMGAGLVGAGCGSNGSAADGAGGAAPGLGGAPSSAAGVAGAVASAGKASAGNGVGGSGGQNAPGGGGGEPSSGGGGSPAHGGALGAGGSAGSAGSGGGAPTAGSAGAGGQGGAPPNSGPPPPLTGTIVAGTVKVTRGTTMGQLVPGFAGFSFEKSHLSDGFFTAEHAALIALFKLLGPGIVRIGADDVNNSVWSPGATFVKPGTTSPNVGTAEVDALADFLKATGWKTLYSVNMRGNSTPQTAVTELNYVVPKLASSLAGVEIGNELNLYNLANVQSIWHSYAAAIHSAFPAVVVAGPGAYLDINFALPFIKGEASQIGLVTHHYYRAAAGTSGATLANLLATDAGAVSQSQSLQNSVKTNNIAGGYRWGEMNSYSSHGQAGVSDVVASALWGINFMLTTAEYGSAGVNFHGGGQNMDGNVCPNGASSCDRPFRYSPILEIDSRVTAAAPLFYGMLLVSQIGTGNMLPTTATATGVNFKAYTVTPSAGGTRIILVNSDAKSGVDASIDIGTAVANASATYLRGPSLTALTGVTLAEAPVTATGTWAPKPGYTLAHTGNVISVPVPAASAVLIVAD